MPRGVPEAPHGEDFRTQDVTLGRRPPETAGWACAKGADRLFPLISWSVVRGRDLPDLTRWAPAHGLHPPMVASWQRRIVRPRTVSASACSQLCTGVRIESDQSLEFERCILVQIEFAIEPLRGIERRAMRATATNLTRSGNTIRIILAARKVVHSITNNGSGGGPPWRRIGAPRSPKTGQRRAETEPGPPSPPEYSWHGIEPLRADYPYIRAVGVTGCRELATMM